MNIQSIQKKLLVMVLLAVPLHGYHYSDSRDYSVAETSFMVAGSVAALSAIGYGFYKCYEHFALKNAQSRLEKQQRVVEFAAEVESAFIKWLQDDYLIEHTTHSLQKSDYDHLCAKIMILETQLLAIRQDIDTALQTWSGVEKAAYFLQTAQVLRVEVNRALEKISAFNRHIDQRAALLELIMLLNTENSGHNTHVVKIVSAAVTGQLTESLVRGQFTKSQWPLSDAHNAIENRKQSYIKALHLVDSFSSQSDSAQTYAALGHAVVQAYYRALEGVAGFKNYTKELRARDKRQQEQKRLEAERIQAEAALRSAQAQEHQARVLRDQAIQQKQHELAQLRHELSEIKRQITAGDTNYYLKQQKRNLQNRIQSLKQELGDNSSLFGVIVDLITDND